MALRAFLLLLFSLPLLHSYSDFLPIPNATGDVLLGVRCPQTLSDCHLFGACYSSFKVCAQLNNKERNCAPVPALEDVLHCQNSARRLLTVLPISINASTERLSVVMKALKKTIISTPELTTGQVQLLPGLTALQNASAPRNDSWKPLTFPLLFEFEAVLQCRQHRYGPLCRTLCKSSDCSPQSPTTTTPSDHCVYNTCFNGGICRVENLTRPTCLCPQGWRGARCEIQDLCAIEPCANGGTCRNERGGAALCECPLGWRGARCELTNPCSPNPCRNGGSCSVNKSDQADCRCSKLWIGALCEVMNPCSKQPCLNGGNCTIAEGSFKCRCPDHAFGAACQLVLPQNMLDSNMIVFVVSAGIILLIAITVIFGICFFCRRSKRIVQSATHLEATLRVHQRERRSSDVYAEIDSENCYSDGSESDNDLETGVKRQRTRTRSTTSALLSSRAVSVVSKDDKTV